MKKKLLFSTVIIILILGIELFLRLYYGFCDTVLIREDTSFEYIAQPNQNRFRFRNHIKYNSKSMRSEEIDTTATLFLGFGDSVINGGVLTDHNSLATSILSDTLSQIYGCKVQFLNISAGSWGPDNCYAYLNKYGDFGAKRIYLFVSSHDAYDNMNFEKIVDINKSFPSKQYTLALYEIVDRYLLPRLGITKKKKLSKNNLGINKKKHDSVFNTGFMSFYLYSKQKGIPLTIYLHADKAETRKGAYNRQGKEIIKFANENAIDIIKDLEHGIDLSDFRDAIHINLKGQKKIALAIIKRDFQ